MKDNIANVLEDFEKLAYKILMWVILVPKTVIKVVVDPGFVPGYVRQELASEKGKQFDEYISPMLLYLGVTLLPAIAIYLLPAFGMEVISPYQDPALFYDAYVETDEGVFSVNDPTLNAVVPATGVELQAFVDERKFLGHEINFRVEMRTRADTSGQLHSFVWKVWECGNRDAEFGYCKYDNFYYGERHDQQYGIACIYGSVFEGGDNPGCLASHNAEPSENDWSTWWSSITFPEKDLKGQINNRNLVSDYFPNSFYIWYKTGEYGVGEYLIEVHASTRSAADPLDMVEFDSKVMELFTYTGSAEFSIKPYASNFISDVDERNSVFSFLGLDINPNSGGEEESRSLADRLESGETIAFGLALLLPPLLIAGAIGIFKGSISFVDEGGSVIQRSSIGEEALKENFYAQCYYFAPVGMAFWAWYYSLNYYTYDIQYRGEWLWIPLALALLWFVVVQIYSIADELPSQSKVGAFFILFGCITAMFLVVRLGQAFAYNYDWLRKSAIWSYPGIAFLLTLGVIYRQFFRKKDKKGAGVKMGE